jgi:CO dehydrogenase maturation factor
MAKIIVTTGRGGSGKTSFMALATRYLSSPDHPSVVIDTDSDQNLGDMLGVHLEKENVRTISDILFDLRKGKGYEELKSMPMPQRIEYLFHSDCIYESERFDLISLGVKWTNGCYCLPNDLLRGIIPRMANSYRHMLVDTPAGLEHLNREVVSKIDDLFVILDPSMKSLKNVKRVQKLSKEIGIKYENFYLVANHKFSDDQEKYIQHIDDTSYLGKIERDPDVEEYNLIGKSLLELPEDSPACLSIKKVLGRAGYETS